MTQITIPEEEQKRTEALPYRLPIKLREILDGFKWATREKNTSAVIIIDGKSGKGKTTLSGQIALYCDASYADKQNNLKAIHWNPQTFLSGDVAKDGTITKIGLEQAQPGSVIIFDEAMIINSRSSMSEINKMIVQSMSMIRSKRLIIIFNVNSFFDLDKNISAFRSDLLLHCYGESLTDRGRFLAFFQGADGQDRIKDLYILGKKYYSYKTPKANFFAEFPSHFVFDEIEYEKKKQQGVNDFLNSGIKDSTKLRKSRDNYILWMKANSGLNVETIADIGGITFTSVYNVLKKYRQDD